MANTAANLLQPGDIIRTEDGNNNLLYVQDFIKNESGEVTDLIVFPIIGDDENISEDMGGFVNTRAEFIQDKSRNEEYPEKLSISFIACARFNRFGHDYRVHKIGSAHKSIIDEINKLFKQLGGDRNIRLSNLSDHDPVKIKGMDWGKYTGGTVVGAIYLDGYEYQNTAAIEGVNRSKRRYTKSSKANTMVTTPDMYLEDAYTAGLVSKELYTFFRYTNEKTNILTLTEAFTAIAKFDNMQHDSEVLDTSFDEDFSDIIGKISEDDSILRDNEVVKKAYNIRLDDEDLYDILPLEVLRPLLYQEDGSGLKCENLGEAIELIVAFPHDLEEYGRKVSKKGELKRELLSDQDLDKIKTAIISAYDTISETIAESKIISKESLLNDLNYALDNVRKSAAGMETERPVVKTKIISRPNLRHTGDEEVNRQIQESLEQIKRNAPPRLER